MRTYDKLIATIHAGQGTAGLRACFGGFVASPRLSGDAPARPTFSQDKNRSDNQTP